MLTIIVGQFLILRCRLKEWLRCFSNNLRITKASMRATPTAEGHQRITRQIPIQSNADRPASKARQSGTGSLVHCSSACRSVEDRTLDEQNLVQSGMQPHVPFYGRAQELERFIKSQVHLFPPMKP